MRATHRWSEEDLTVGKKMDVNKMDGLSGVHQSAFFLF